ncbi:hypothetical protein P152DRAFT_479892 [Eremomyces bilateralis CBS 781.70]|uniref:Uncharacterized protein n=1 Tax=Eremomyces bilateralis CBS 781.70 TaxID=1392243 RepID=A0A6G1G9Q1_9PEZI|nr:uncharacterized protein P152DRAFT_479892 [Eremomyces bilateralis CBS 781.70]KAF1814753.1 hypothetical protein P152DRAFT_479892 [Eremomyces bilateralis CBS 781.70]
MATPLSPSSQSHLNSRLFILDSTMTSTPQKSHQEPGEETFLDWKTPASSPFVSEIEQENRDPNTLNLLFELNPTKPQSKNPSPIKTAPDLQDEDIIDWSDEPTQKLSTTPTVTSPEKQPGDQLLEEMQRSAAIDTVDTVVPSSRRSSPKKRQLDQFEIHSDSSQRSSVTTSSSFSRETKRQETIVISNDIDMTLPDENEDPAIDDTCFSMFSEIPNTDMTAFAKLGQSPTKTFSIQTQTPRALNFMTPSTSRRTRPSDLSSPSPTPRQRDISMHVSSEDTTNLLLDFTQQFEAFSKSSMRTPTGHGSPTKTEPHLLSYINQQRSPQKPSVAPPNATPSKSTLLNLLDFELPPAPTPRSIPTITVRELESLKSTYQSQISSLTASLSGRDAEVSSLKRAVADAERRVGEAAESLRDERGAREHVEQEKEAWERKREEVESVLRSVRDEVMKAEKEREEIEKRVEEAETRATEAEQRAVEAAKKVTVVAPVEGNKEGGEKGLFTAEQVQRQIDEKVHALSAELHAIYKKKHITKVAGLKKGFEEKSKKLTDDLHQQVAHLTHQVEDLQSSKDATLSGPIALPSGAIPASELASLRAADLSRLESQQTELEATRASLAGLTQELRTLRTAQDALHADLEQERIEKGELVAAVDELLALQTEVGPVEAVEDFRKSIARPSGLRGPGFGAKGQGGEKSRIGRIGVPAAPVATAAPGLVRSVSGGKSRMMSQLERMGSGRMGER